jgi:hypothetical protein
MRSARAEIWPREACALALAAMLSIACSPTSAPQNSMGSGGAGVGGATGSGSGGNTATATGGGSSGGCPAGMALCGGACVAVLNSPTNCGGCGLLCNAPGQQCSNGACGCASGYSDCGSGCVAVTSDPANCGSCGNACGLQVCSSGVCSDSCAAGLKACTGACIDVNTDPANCGDCGKTCAAGSQCVSGTCQCSGGFISCGGSCVDVKSDATHCGTCSTVCSSGLCVAGVCQAGTSGSGGGTGVGGATGTGGTGATGGAAAGTGGASVSCEAPLSACDSRCVDLQTDAENCGKCYTACPTGVCNAGVCPKVKDCYKPIVVTSPLITDFEDYDGTDLTKWGFAFNGKAGTADAVYAGPYFYDDDTGTPTSEMTTGHESTYAVSTSNPQATNYGGGMGLWMGCVDAKAYAGVSLWVRGETPTGTVNLTVAMEDTTKPSEDDPAGGGTCESTSEDDCKPGNFDVPVTSTWANLLVPWESFKPGIAAGGKEVPIDGHNVTGLGFSIPLEYVPVDPEDPEGEYKAAPGAYELEVDDIGFIASGACPAGQELCGVACADYQTDKNNCGSCGNACDASRACVGGKCVCPTNYTDCEGQCVDLQIDSQNCGGCGKPCSGPCVGGTCQASTCTAGAAKQEENCTEGSSITLGKYWVNNNQWGDDGVSGQLCIWKTCESGNTVGWGTSWEWSGGSASQVKSYGSIILGWQWGWKIQNTGLPVQLSASSNVTCGWTFKAPASGTFNVAYDLFAHTAADPGSSSDPTDEIMIWLYSGNGAAPIGAQEATATVAATTWALHRGNNGRWNVMSYVRASNTESATFNIMDFTKDLVSRGWIASSKYLVSIQAGSEAFTGSAELDTSSYYCTIQ